jgi:hypothetical protein
MTTDLDRANARVLFPYNVIRNISAPEDSAGDRKVFSGNAPARSFLPLPENENVRSYIVSAEGKKKHRLTDVHRRIRETLANNPDEFVVLNSGIAIVAESIEVDDASKKAFLIKPSIINGSQTRGELKHYIDQFENTDYFKSVSCKFEIIVTADSELIADVSIARNFQNDVATLSIVGRRGVLDELEERLSKYHSDIKLRKSETQRSDDYLDTEKLLQVITALVPAQIWSKNNEKEDPKKVYTYSMKAKCLKEFEQIFDRAKNGNDQKAEELYGFYIDIAPKALELYDLWKKHPGFKGTGLRSILRNGSEIVEVPDGIIFPIIASLSAFVKKKHNSWVYLPPVLFKDEEIIRAAKSQYQNVANSNPWNMGKSASIYSSLYQITSIYNRLSS